MRLSLHEVLAIVGRLDDAPGFDTPRKRFRQFLVEHMTSVAVARTFLDEAQQLISEQYQRALQDTVLVAGTLLGFEINFSGYERHGGAARIAGQWLSRRRLAVTVQLWSDAAASDPGALSRTLETQLLDAEGTPARARLCVVTPSFGSRHRLDERATMAPEPTRIVSLRSLMDLLSVVGTAQVTHDDVIRLLHPTPAMEGSIALLARLVNPARPAPQKPAAAEASPPAHTCWVYVVREREGGEHSTGVVDIMQMTLPVGEAPATAADDSVAFFVPSKGVVAHARVASVSEATDRTTETHAGFTVRLRDIVIVDPPVAIETEQRLNLELQAAVSHEPYVQVGRREFDDLTKQVDGLPELPTDVRL